MRFDLDKAKDNVHSRNIFQVQTSAYTASAGCVGIKYGYMKNPADKKQWLRDEDAAQVVYDIGLYVMEGYGPSQIARKLKERKILTPAAYYESKGITCNVKKDGNPYAWDNTTIAHIMDNWRV